MDIVSVIVPVYNSEPCLERCLNSILNQSYNFLEIILVDDSSNDNSLSICNDYALRDSRLKVKHHAKNRGVSASRNTGLNEVTGKYVIFIDSDDYVSLNFIEILLDLCKKWNVSLIKCDYLRTENGEEIAFVPNSTDTFKVYENQEELHWSFASRDRIINCLLWATLYRASLFNDLRFPEGKIYEDQAVMHYLLYRAGRVGALDTVLYFCCPNPNSITRKKFTKERFDSLEAFKDRYLFYLSLGWEKVAYSILLRYMLTIMDYINKSKEFIPCSEAKQIEFLEEYKSYLPTAINSTYSRAETNIFLKKLVNHSEELTQSPLYYVREWMGLPPSYDS